MKNLRLSSHVSSSPHPPAAKSKYHAMHTVVTIAFAGSQRQYKIATISIIIFTEKVKSKLLAHLHTGVDHFFRGKCKAIQ